MLITLKKIIKKKVGKCGANFNLVKIFLLSKKK